MTDETAVLLITNSARRCKDNMETAVKTQKGCWSLMMIITSAIQFRRYLKEDMLVDYENNASDGVKRAIAERYEVIIVDVHLPGMDGVSLLPVLKELAPSSRVILTSGDTLLDVLNEHSNIEIENFIQKPIDKEKLLKAIGVLTP